MNSDTRRERANNFTENEKDLLIKIVTDDFFHIIESKKTDAASLKEKNKAWYSVSEIFNVSSHCNIPRNVLQLKNAYHNMKTRLKKEFISEDHKTQYVAALSKVNNVKAKYIRMLNLPTESNNITLKGNDSTHAIVDFVINSDQKELDEESDRMDTHEVNGSSFDMELPEPITNGTSPPINNFSFRNNLRRRKLYEIYKNIDRSNFNKKLQVEYEILQIKKRREEEGLQIDKVKRLQEDEKLKQQKIHTELLKMQLRQREEVIIGD